MTFTFGKTIAAAVLTVSLAATPALADGWGHRGWGGGYGGWGHPHHGGYWGGAAAAGVLGALAVGAIAASQQPAYPAYRYYDGSCYPADQPIVDAWGNVVSYRRVEVCE